MSRILSPRPEPKSAQTPAVPPPGRGPGRLAPGDCERFQDFWRCLRADEDFGRQYGHCDPVPNWRDRPDRDLERAFGRIKRPLAALARPATFPGIPGLPEADGPIIATTAHEAVFQLNRFPNRWVGAIGALDGEVYAAVRAEAERELHLLLNARSAADVAAPARPTVRGEFDDHGRLVFRCTRDGHPADGPVALTGQSLRLLVVLDCTDYRQKTTGWDEFVWHQVWGVDRRDGKPPVSYRRGVQADDSADGPPARFRRAIAALERELRGGVGVPPGGDWVERHRMTRSQRAYLLTDRATWKLIPAHNDRGGECSLAQDELDAAVHPTHRRLKPPPRGE